MYPGTAKAWHLHERQTDWWYCIGSLKVALYDLRDGSPTLGRTMTLFMRDRCDLPEDPTWRRAWLPRVGADSPGLRDLTGVRSWRRRTPALRRSLRRLRLDVVS